MAQWWLCEICQTHWEGEEECPVCGEVIEIRKTMSKDEARAKGLLEE